MRTLFIHQNFPAQFGSIAAALAAEPGQEVAAIATETVGHIPDVRIHRYAFSQHDVGATHPFARRFDIECRRAEQILYVASELALSGFAPDVVVAHHGWGETLPLRAAFPNARIIAYCEYYYRPTGGDVGFDPAEVPLTRDAEVTLRLRNASTLLALAECDAAVSATPWQKSTFPIEFQSKIQVCHEGVDTDRLRPNVDASVSPRPGLVLRPGDEVVTFVARDLEPIRGYPSFMRALPQVLRNRPNCHVLIVGGDGTSYGAAPPVGDTWKAIGLRAVASEIDQSRVHFLGRLPYDDYVKVLQVSAVHVYLTAPFVLSWSLIEAMSTGCAVIASDVAPCRDVIDGDTGLLADFFDADDLVFHIIHVLANRDHAKRLGRSARDLIERRYRSDTCIAAMRKIIGP